MTSFPSGEAGREAARSLESRFSRSGRLRSAISRKLAGVRWGLLISAAAGCKRLTDWLAAAALLTLASPVFAAAAAVASARRKPVFARTVKVGRWCEEFQELAFAPELGGLWRSRAVRRLPVAWNVLRGDISLVGPRATVPGEMSPRQRQIRRRYDVRPGVVCLWWLRRRANIAYETEAAVDGEYVDSQSPMRDLGIALRALPSVLYGETAAAVPDVVRILDIELANLTMTEAVEWIEDRLRGPAAAQVCFVNPDCANISVGNREYREALADADLVLADGIGLKLAGKLAGTPIKQNVNGTDLFPRLLEKLARLGLSVYLLGARPGVAERVGAWIGEHHAEVRVAGCRHGYFTPDEEPEVLAEIRRRSADLLLVAFGSPRQDIWIARHLEETGAKVAIGVGGLFDFYSGRIPRAPVWIREIGMEWLYRFAQEPRRMWKRYFIGNAVFLARVWRQRRRREAKG